MPKCDILITGVGGQGTILAGRVIATLALEEGLDVKTAETHGMAQRGGSVITHVRFGDRVYSPLVPPGSGDFLLSFEKLEALRWLPLLSPRGTAIVNTRRLFPLPVLTGQADYPTGICEEIASHVDRLVAVDALETAVVRENPRTANTFLLGLLAHWTPFAPERWLEVLESQLKKGLFPVNKLAFEAGLELARAGAAETG